MLFTWVSPVFSTNDHEQEENIAHAWVSPSIWLMSLTARNEQSSWQHSATQGHHQYGTKCIQKRPWLFTNCFCPLLMDKILFAIITWNYEALHVESCMTQTDLITTTFSASLSVAAIVESRQFWNWHSLLSLRGRQNSSLLTFYLSLIISCILNQFLPIASLIFHKDKKINKQRPTFVWPSITDLAVLSHWDGHHPFLDMGAPKGVPQYNDHWVKRIVQKQSTEVFHDQKLEYWKGHTEDLAFLVEVTW